MNTIPVNDQFLQKISEFTKVAIEEIDDLEAQLNAFQKKAAAEGIAQRRFEQALEKAADALYKSDFITDIYERKEFLKRAKEDPAYLTRMIVKLCDAADVAPIGTPARVTSLKQAEYDPVMARAFGWGKGSPDSLVLED